MPKIDSLMLCPSAASTTLNEEKLQSPYFRTKQDHCLLPASVASVRWIVMG